MQIPNNLKINVLPVLGVPLAATDYKEAVALTRSWVEPRPEAVYAVAAANTHLVALSRSNRPFAEALARFDLILPDGMPLLWTMNRCGAGLKDRVYGPTLMLHALAQPGISHFLLGGTEEVLQSLTSQLRERYPGLILAGHYSPPFGDWPEGENERIFQKIAASGAQYIWVGLGCPKQEHWIARHKANLPPGVYFGVGAAFAFHAGRVRQAPVWMQKRGLEWLFRLAAEPRRLWKRYVVYNTLFVVYLLLDALRRPARR
jgi:N-acetylglucosaminyldiphosphoundecaprenol N-acetyl-beta-D-mannosaminyltransferase